MNAFFANRTLIAAVLTAIAAVLTSTGVLPAEVSANHIDAGATLILALYTAWTHGNVSGIAAAVEGLLAPAPAAPATTDQPAK